MVKPGYKLTEIGEIPEDWEEKELAEVCIINPSSSEPYPHEFIYVDLESVVQGKLVEKKLIDRKDAPIRARRRFSKGDILYQTVRPYQKNNLLVEFDSEKYIASTGYAVIREKSEILISRFLYFYLQTDIFVSEVIDNCTGTSYPAINPNILAKLKICIPVQTKEQERIAEALSNVDGLIASLEKLIAKKKAIKQGVMQRLLTGKTRLPGFGFEGKWEEVRVEDIANFSTLTVLFKKTDIKYYIGTDNMIADKGGICENKIDIEYNNVREYITDDILLSNIRPYLKKIWFADRCGGCSNDVLVIRCKDKSVIIPQFLFYLLSQDIFFDVLTENAIGTKMPRGDKSVIKSFVLHIPTDIHEQKAVVAVLSDIDKEIESLSQKLAKTRQLKQGMMQQLLTGKIRLV